MIFFALFPIVSGTFNCLVLTDVSGDFSNLLTSLNCATTKSLSDPSVHLSAYGTYLYDSVAILVSSPGKFVLRKEIENMHVNGFVATTSEVQLAHMKTRQQSEEARGQGQGLSLKNILDFIDNNKGNLFLAINSGKPSSDLDDLLKELGGFKIGKKVSDFFSNHIFSSPPFSSEPWMELVAGGQRGVVLFDGSAVVIPETNPNMYPILRSSETAVGSPILAAAHQTLSGARIAVLGSLSMLSDKTMGENKFNKIWAQGVVGWTFGRRGILRLENFRHHKVGHSIAPKMYREKDHVQVHVRIEEKAIGPNGEVFWTPFITDDKHPVQLEYIMLDPHVRQPMVFNSITKEYDLQFQVPDVYGIFKFRIDYQNKGFNNLVFEQVAPVRNFKHNDYDRFLFCAFPYYASCFVTLGLVVAFAFLFVNHKDRGWKQPEKELRHRE